MSAQPKVAMCETCPAWRTNGAPEGTCKRMPNGPHTLGTNYCMHHPANRHLMEPPAKSDGSRLYVGGEVFEPANVLAFVSRSAYDSLMKERDSLKYNLELVRRQRDSAYDELNVARCERDALKDELAVCRRIRELVKKLSEEDQ